ncbi:MAG: hypothetical protein WBR18_08470 [Anaerolineales bacterium]
MRTNVIRWIVLIAFVPLWSGCAGLTPSLMLEEHPLEREPDADTASFEPVGSNQQYVLNVHKHMREDTVNNAVTSVDGMPAIRSLGDTDGMMAVLETSNENPPRQTVTVLRGEDELFSVDAGLPSPVLPLQSLWSMDDDWTLEILYADQEVWSGQIYVNGGQLNTDRGYDEAFGYQYLADKPFYFFNRAGELGYSYDGRETSLKYDQIPHYNCCSESTLNPVHARDMVAFFAQQGEQWYYVELGQF